jgi:iron complex outermembrane receptor protein
MSLNHDLAEATPVRARNPRSCASRSVMALLVFGALLSRTSAALAGNLDRVVVFDIQAQALQSALVQFGVQAHVQLGVSVDRQLRRLRVPALKGAYTGRQALSILLSGTGLKFAEDNRTVEILPRRSRTKGSATPADPKPANGARMPTNPQGGIRPLAEGVKPPLLQTVIVTGTHLAAPNPTQPAIVLTREDIERDGYATTGQLFMALPQVFGGGQSGATPDGVYGPGSRAAYNVTGATGINLFGLGASATLVLVDGRRLTPTDEGEFADVSMIPISAIERIEIITDGASAIYGADAVAGVVNIILRHNYRGMETSVIAGGTTAGGADQQTISQSAGTKWATGNVSGSVSYTHGSTLTAAQRPGIAKNLMNPNDLYPDSRTYSGTLNGEQRVTDALSFNLNGLLTEEHVNRSTNTTYIGLEDYQESVHNLGFTVGANYKFNRAWSLISSVDFGQDEVQDNRAFPGSSGNPASVSRINSRLTELSPEILIRGKLLKLPGGQISVALGASYRSEKFTYDYPASSGTTSLFRQRLDRNVHSEFAELEVPIVGSRNRIAGVSALDLSLALRRDVYSDFGSTTNPRVGVRWSPVRAMSLLGSWSTSFRAPSQFDSIETVSPTFIDIYPLTAPDGHGTVPTFITFGGSLPLTAERAHTLNVGATLAPPNSGFKGSIYFFDVLYKNQIVTPPLVLNALTEQSVYGPLITALQNDAAAAAYLDAAKARGWSVVDLIGSGASGVRYIYDVRQRNAQQSKESGVQLNLSYRWQYHRNVFDTSAQALLLDKFQQSLGGGSAVNDLLGTFGYPVKQRARLEFAWERGSWTVGGAGNFISGYTNDTVNPAAPVASWTTLDFHLGYAVRSRTPVLRGLRVDLNVINAFDRGPPFVLRAIPTGNVNYDSANANPLGRLVNVQLTKEW